MPRVLRLVLACLAFALPARATVYVVAQSGGDFTAIQPALDAAVAGDVVRVREKPTPYFEKLVFPRSGNSSAGPIVLEAFPGEQPVVDGTGVPGADMILIPSRSWVTVSGLELQNNLGVTDGSGIRVTGAGDHIELRSNRIHDMRGENAMGITVYATEPTPIADLVIDGNEIYDCEPAPSEALTLNGNVTGFAVTNNVVRDVNNIGIDFIGGETDIQPDPTLVARNGVCRGNVVTRARSIYGGGYAGGIYIDGGRDIVVERNVVSESDLGLEVGAENRDVDATGNVVRDNVLHHNDKAGLVFGGYAPSVGRVRNCRFLNNTLYGNDTLGVGLGELWIQYAENNDIRNNLFFATSAGRLLTSDAGNDGNLLDYNLWFTTGTPEFVWNGTPYGGLAAYQAGTGQDAHALFANPLLVNAAGSDFHLGAGSPAINAGDPAFVPAPDERDLDGQPRVNGARVDLGADETGFCGNGVPDPGEGCDDGDLVDGDGCDSNCTPTGCGNRIVTTGETCDDGNTAAGDCCGSTCQLEAPGSPCTDGNPCTTADACSAGTCVGTSQPEPSCASASGGVLVVRDGVPSRRRLVWRWSGGTAPFADLGNPALDGVPYALCLYDRSAGTPALHLRADIPAGGSCQGSPCWQPLGGNGLRYRDRDLTPDGIQMVKAKAGTGNASFLVKARGSHVPAPGLPLQQDPAVTVQLKRVGGQCWQSTYTAPATRSDDEQFKDSPD